MKLGVIGCTCRGEISGRVDFNRLAAALRGSFQAAGNDSPDPALAFETANNLCEQPLRLRNLIKKNDLERVVIAACSPKLYGEFFKSVAREAGLSSLSVELVDIRERAAWVHPRGATEKAFALLCAALEKAKLREIPAENLKLAAVKLRRGASLHSAVGAVMSGLLREEVVPAIRKERCRENCSACIPACASRAVRVERVENEETKRIDKDACTACGACASACTLGAIDFPHFNLSQLGSVLRVLLSSEIQTKVIVFTCSEASQGVDSIGEAKREYHEGVFVLELPCAGVLSPELLLLPFLLGASGVGLLFGAKECSKKYDYSLLERNVALARRIIGAFELGERIETLSGDFAEAANKLAKKVSPLNMSSEFELSYNARDSLRSILLSFSTATNKKPELSLSASRLPFGLVKVSESCTLCGACVTQCATDALSVMELDSREQLRFQHLRCIACGTCAAVCPEKAISLSRTFDLRRTLEGTIETVAEFSVVKCEKCGKPVAPDRAVHKVLALMAKSRSPEQLKQWEREMKLCLECRSHAKF